MLNEPDWADDFGLNDRASDDASAAWARVVADIDIPASQQDAAAQYCVAVARIAEAERHISEHGLILTGANGGPVKNPATTLINMYGAAARAHQNALGLTPYSAARNKAMSRNAKTVGDDEYQDSGTVDPEFARLISGFDRA
ncbi:P27 family phage terminase small subunit [Streptomyces sp. WMMB303]|uniref:P27 family phage terminase small subunit n=1 Tax=Streptomyces sp. WMMB303 TaxID=3034154 RepID=UPI0023ECE324|nr:P27 family phage terminase small subunit [Streptomyces sp. WMMB303]MDF4250093.1 P27 family phage terminase small subunit [Streptomyces sp. WMMB303]